MGPDLQVRLRVCGTARIIAAEENKPVPGVGPGQAVEPVQQVPTVTIPDAMYSQLMVGDFLEPSHHCGKFLQRLVENTLQHLSITDTALSLVRQGVSMNVGAVAPSTSERARTQSGICDSKEPPP